MVAIESAGAGDPLVLLHGVGTSRRVWDRVVPTLAETRLVATADLPGFGDSPPSGDGFDLTTAAHAVADSVGDRVSAPFDLLGSSLGGAIAVVLAWSRPELVCRLVLCAPAGFAPRPSLVAKAVGGVGAGALALRRVVGPPLAASPTARRVLLFGAVDDPALLAAADARAMLTASAGASRVSAALTAVLAADLRPQAADLRVPVGLVWGERDRVVPRSTARSIEALLPRAPLETIPRAGHVPQVERPLFFVRAVERILSRLPA